MILAVSIAAHTDNEIATKRPYLLHTSAIIDVKTLEDGVVLAREFGKTYFEALNYPYDVLTIHISNWTPFAPLNRNDVISYHEQYTTGKERVNAK